MSQIKPDIGDIVPGKTLDEEIKRAMAPHFNFVQPVLKCKILAVNNGNVDIEAGVASVRIRGVPVLKPCYGTVGGMNLNIGEYVLVAFMNGQFGAPVVVGKF